MTGPTRGQVRFKERADLLDYLLEVAGLMSETIDLDDLLESVTSVIQQVVPSQLFAILLFSEKKRQLRIRHAVGHREELVRNMVISLGEGLTGIAAESRQPVVVNDVLGDPRYLMTMDAVRSEMAIPMVIGRKLVGVIDLQSIELNAFSADDRALMVLLASRIAAFIQNARLYRRVQRQMRMLRTLKKISVELSSILAVDELLKKIADRLRRLINYDAISVLLVDEEKKLLRHRFSIRYDKRVEIDNIPMHSGLTGAAIQSGRPVKVNDTAADPRYIASHEDIRSEVAVPLIRHGKPIGVLDLESDHLGFFTDDHVRILTLLAPHVATAIENARLYEELAQREQRFDQDLRAARKLQKILLPRVAPPIAGLEIALGARPAREISGDIYDFFDCDKCGSLVCFGDSSGKSAAAALYGALVSGLLRSLAGVCQKPADLMAHLNETLLERRVETKYVTMLLMLWDAPSRRFHMTNAGNTPPMVCRGDKVFSIDVAGIPLGLLDGRAYDEVVFQAEPGDLILLHSDGVADQLRHTEEEDEEAADYGVKRIEKLLAKVRHNPVNEIVGNFFDELNGWAAGAPITDDQSILVMRVL
ncbi:MAG: GAF domain-containing protein [Bryobacterales bacterium]|nr:GAF domain-containing protein [Bryobacterales bacterium]